MKMTLHLLVPWRLLIFALLGPPIGLCFAMWVLLPLFDLALGDRPVFDWHQIVLLPLSYLLGLVPACVVAVFDAVLAGRHVSYRPLWTALFGFAASFLPLLSSLMAGFVHGPIILLFGLVGAVPAALCSSLAGRWPARQPLT